MNTLERAAKVIADELEMPSWQGAEAARHILEALGSEGLAVVAQEDVLTAEEAGAVADGAANLVPHSEINWKAQDSGIEKLRRLAALSRVPADGEMPTWGAPDPASYRGGGIMGRRTADGEQPAGELYPSYPEHDEVDEAASSASRQERPGPRPVTRDDLMHVSRDGLVDLILARQERPHVEGTVSPVKGWLPRSAHPDEQPGLGDLQLTGDQSTTEYAVAALERAGYPIIAGKLRRLASRENPE